MKDFMRKVREQHPIKDVAIFIGGILTGSVLSTMNDDRILNKDDVFVKRSNEQQKTSGNSLDENEE